jgi:SAM-dependent methyltransferase
LSIPFGDSDFDFVTAVCVYHHISPSARPALTLEVCRVLRPGGVFCMIEHNPLNPITRLIVSRTPVDADAILLPAKEGQRLVFERGCVPSSKNIFCKNRISISAVLSR